MALQPFGNNVPKLRVLELFAGHGEVSKAFRAHGHEAITLDYDEQLHPDLCLDIFSFTPDDLPAGWMPDIIWASPDCTCWSVAAMHHNWYGHDRPKRTKAYIAQMMVLKTLSIIDELHPALWWMENPRGMLRCSFLMRGLPRKTVTYCQYGDTAQKPTDIWTNCHIWKPRRMCAPKAPCHVRAPRSTHNDGSTQGKSDAEERSIIPAELCAEVAEVSERYMMILREELLIDQTDLSQFGMVA